MTHKFRFLLAIFTMLLLSCTNQDVKEYNTTATDTTNYNLINRKQNSVVKYEIHNPEISVTPTKTLYRANIILKETGGFDDETNKTLLSHIYDSIMNSNDKPDAVALYLFPNKEHSQSGMAQWVARLSKSKLDKEPSLFVQHFESETNERKSASEKNILSVEKRKLIFSEIIHVEDEATQQADRKYPLTNTANYKKNEDYRRTLMTSLKYKIQKKYKLDKESLKTISMEGLKYNWPMPPYQKD
ncbi:hypothetical protein [Sphingobacterium bambusae]|uniref:Lipoprotein n=1 Tax=Sphingobacterium bambusae TaxID=662858 RepID=A0ABW6BHC2_9SPHI|nr:hypothetical protein [Sphingobacterium bambusae]WPL49367.1 hypothetical protein SCB77_02735 [Sphingobacterium bambusae]